MSPHPKQGVVVLMAIASMSLGTAWAQNAPQPSPDANAARAEAFQLLATDLQLRKQHDVDGDGRLSPAERQTARAAARAAAAALPKGNPTGQAGSPGRRMAPADVPPVAGDLYDPRLLRTIFLEFENPDWESELADFYNTDIELPATMTVDGRVYREVGVGFRGASSFVNTPPGRKRSLNISVDAAVDGQNLGGYRTLNLLNSHGDGTFLRTILYAEIARRYVPAPKVNFMHVVINGESWGVYVNAQQFNTDFTREAFGQRGGARWKVSANPSQPAGLAYLGDDAGPYRPLYGIRSRDDEGSWRALIQLTKVLHDTPLDQLESALAPMLDIDGVLRFLALEVALASGDGYWVRASDYNLYRDPAGRFHLVPHDMNEAFRLGQTAGVSRTEIDPLVGVDDPTKPLRSRLLSVPVLRQRYLAYVREIAERWLTWEAVTAIVKPAHDLIRAEVKADTRKQFPFEEFEAALNPSTSPLKAFVETRRAFLLNATSR